ncbi:hypothetical protein CPC08DRAFT_761192 [Agrocybe pediades]|nr:hypothetical protein CPC08DRAFT_761192 [Agrocybe pediades]
MSATSLSTTWKVILASFYTFSILATVFRLTHRFKRKQWSWDDFHALVALSGTLGIVFVLIFSQVEWGLIDAMPGVVPSVSTWLTFVAHATGSSVNLIGRPKGVSKRKSGKKHFDEDGDALLSRVAAGNLPKAVGVRQHRIWGTASLQIHTGDGDIRNYNLCADLYGLFFWPAIVILVYSPALRLQHRRLFVACFACILFPLVSSLVHGAYLLKRDKKREVSITSHIQTSIYLLACNTLVLGTYLYRVVHRSDGDNRNFPTIPLDETGWDSSGAYTRRLAEFRFPDPRNLIQVTSRPAGLGLGSRIFVGTSSRRDMPIPLRDFQSAPGSFDLTSTFFTRSTEQERVVCSCLGESGIDRWDSNISEEICRRLESTCLQ